MQKLFAGNTAWINLVALSIALAMIADTSGVYVAAQCLCMIPVIE